MAGFLKVRASAGPQHAFYAPVEAVAAFPGDYVVLDATPVSKPGNVEYATAVAPPGEPDASWTAAALKAYAAEHDIALGTAKSKPDILAAIAEASEPPATSLGTTNEKKEESRDDS